jgi:cell envelope-related function transcriptional attenuator common domain
MRHWGRKKFVFLICCMAAVLTVSGFGILGFFDQTYPDDITYNGQTYSYNKNLENILLLGVDLGKGYTDNTYGGHQADTLILMSIDKTTKQARLIDIPRDSLTRVKAYDANGNFACYDTMPICLAHSFGKDERSGSELQMEAVSYFLYGVPVQKYISMNIDGISKANDLVGGVTVQVMDEFTSMDPAMKRGAWITLTGEEAMNYVRQRSLPGMSGSNIDRMQRQIQYAVYFLGRVKQKTITDKLFPVKLLADMKDYVSTNLNVFDFASLMQTMMDQEITAQDLQVVAGQQTAEGFTADGQSLQDLIRKEFYVKNN